MNMKILFVFILGLIFVNGTVMACPQGQQWMGMLVTSKNSESEKQIFPSKESYLMPGASFAIGTQGSKCTLSDVVKSAKNESFKSGESMRVQCDLPGGTKFKSGAAFTIDQQGKEQSVPLMFELEVEGQSYSISLNCLPSSLVK